MNDGIETGSAAAHDYSNCERANTNSYPSIDLGRVWFTTHALDQFHDRYSVRVPTGLTPLELLSRSEEDQTISLESKKERLRRHRYEARYFVSDQWRFVIVERGNILSVVTFEEKHFPVSSRKRWFRSRWERRKKSRRDAIW